MKAEVLNFHSIAFFIEGSVGLLKLKWLRPGHMDVHYIFDSALYECIKGKNERMIEEVLSKRFKNIKEIRLVRVERFYSYPTLGVGIDIFYNNFYPKSFLENYGK